MNQVCTGGGIVTASELPYNPNPPTYLPPAGDWPLHVGWQNRAVVATNWASQGGSVAAMKTALKTYGPGVISIDAGTFFYYPNGSSSTDATGTPGVGIDHQVSVVGWHDATSADDAAIQSAGGYWIIKNSWGAWNDNGYGFVPYNLVTSADFYTGPAYYTGALATATWSGSSGTWTAGSGNWTSGASGYSWVNQETAAVFNASANNNITISGPAIAHALTFNAGATGYVFSGGSLTVTAGGITANESVVINSPVTIGAPQTWTTAAGKSLTINGNVSTIISMLTVGGAGATTINGVIGDGGALTGIGGGLAMIGPGTLALTASNTYSNQTTVAGGLMSLSGSGAISSSAAISLFGGTMLLDNSTVNNPNRITSTIPVVLQGGELALQGNDAGTVQAVNSLALRAGGYGTLTVMAGSSARKLASARLPVSAGGAALVRGSSLGTATSGSVAQITFSTVPTLSSSGTGTKVGILPYLYGDNSPTGSGTDLVTYAGGYGVCLLSSSQYNNSIVASTNVKLANSATASFSTTLLSLVLANSGSPTQFGINSGRTLTLSGGALLSTGGTANAVTGGSLTFGNNSATGYEGVISTVCDLAIGSSVINNGTNAVTLTKIGPATLTLFANNTYSGPTYIGGGTLQMPSGGAATGGGAFTIGGNAASLTINGGTVSTSASGNSFYLGGVFGQTGIVNFSAGSIASSNASGTLLLGDSGTGIWNQSGGTVNIAGGVTGANSAGGAANHLQRRLVPDRRHHPGRPRRDRRLESHRPVPGDHASAGDDRLDHRPCQRRRQSGRWHARNSHRCRNVQRPNRLRHGYLQLQRRHLASNRLKRYFLARTRLRLRAVGRRGHRHARL